MPEFGHLIPKTAIAVTRRVDEIELAISSYVGRRLAGWWTLRTYPDFREGRETPSSVAAASDEGLAEVLAYIERIGPSIKGTDWSGSGWVGKGRKKTRK